MFILNISYEEALKGAYSQGPVCAGPLSDYFAERGAIVSINSHYDRNLMLGTDHVENIRNLIMSVGDKGFNKLYIRLTNEVYEAIKENISRVKSLPKIVAHLSVKQDEKYLRIIYQGKMNSRMEAELRYLTPEELDALIEEAFDSADSEGKNPLSELPEDARMRWEEAIQKINKILGDGS